MADGNIIRSIPGFVGGVSQQSPVVRLETQAALSDNTLATLADGLMQRPNGDFIAKLSLPSSTVGYFKHRISRDSTEKYLVFIGNNATNPIAVFDLAGNQKTVNYGLLDADLNFTPYSSVKSYLTSGITNAATQLKAVSVADYTIIVNTTKTCAMKSAVTKDRLDVAYVWFKRRVRGAHKITVHYTVSGVEQSFNAEISWDDAGDAVDTDGMAEWFYTNLAAADTNDYFWFEVKNSVLRIQRDVTKSTVDDNSLWVESEDPYGGEGMISINKCQVYSMDRLPMSLSPVLLYNEGWYTEDVKIKVAGKKDEKEDDYYLQFDSTTRVWTEDVGFNAVYQMDDTTLPHRLVRMSDGTFVFARCLWAERTVGDEESAPEPSFIGTEINNVRFHKNRLWFLSKDNCIGSKASDFFNFFRSTVMDVLDNDPIDVAGTGEQVVNLRSGKGFDKGLMLISDEEQFVLTSGEQAFTPSSVAIDSTTEFNADPNCEPAKIGPDVYFVSPKGSYFTIRQYTIMPDTLIQDAYDIAYHVPKYIPKGAYAMLAGCNQMDMLFLWTEAEPTSLFVYKFLYDDNKKVQQAWQRWTFDCDIVGFKVFGTDLYVTFDDSVNGYRLEKFDLEVVPYSGEPFRYHMDSLMKVSGGVYDGSSKTTFTLPLSVGSGWQVATAGTGVEVTPLTLNSTTLEIAGDVSGNSYFVGRRYEMRHRLSEFYNRKDDGSAIIAGKLVIRTLTLSFENTGPFQVEVTAQGRDTLEPEAMTGLRIGESMVGGVPMLSGEKDFTVAASSKNTTIDIVTDSYFPVAIQTGNWTGTFTVKGRVT